MKRKWMIVLLITLSFLFISCQGQQQLEMTTVAPTDEPITTTAVETKIPFQFTAENFPRMDGSTATIPLGEAVRALLLGENRSQVEVDFQGTYSAYLNLIYDSTDIIIAYEPPEDTREFIASEGVELLMAPIGRDALVFLVNQMNSVTSLTDGEIKGIYSGAITNWQQVGGENEEVKAFQRNDTSGSQTLMKKLVMQDVALMEPLAELRITGMGELIEVISQYENGPGAIGYNVYYYVTKMKDEENVKVLSIDGIKPDDKTISTGEYPYVNDFYVAIRANAAPDSPEKILFDWLQGEDGQALIAHEGYCVIAE